MKNIILFGFIMLCSTTLVAQLGNKKIMDHDVFDFWNKIENVNISNSGTWVSYNVNPHKGDGTLAIYNTRTQKTITVDRAKDAHFTEDEKFISFLIKPHFDTIQSLKRKKAKETEFPKDTLGYYNLLSQELTAISGIESFKTPKENPGLLAYKIGYPSPEKQDSITTKDEKKDEFTLIVRDLMSGREDSLHVVENYQWAKDGRFLVAHTKGQDSTEFVNLKIYNPILRKHKKIWEKENGVIKHISIDENSKYVGFLSHMDTTDSSPPPYALNLWSYGNSNSKVIMDGAHVLLDDDWSISENRKLSFSKDSRYMFFGVAENPLEQDTSLLDDEIVNVEVWTTKDQVLYTEQEAMLKDDLNHTDMIAYNTTTGVFNKTNDEAFPDVRLSDEASDYVLVSDYRKYRMTVSWEGLSKRDGAIVNLKTGERRVFAMAENGNFGLSPHGKYVYWYNNMDSLWRSYDISRDRVRSIADNNISKFYDETNDRPMHPYPNGMAGWTENDEFALIYDKYDIWKIDPKNKKKAKNLTNGRASKKRYRYVQLDREESNIPLKSGILLQYINEDDKTSGYAWLDGRSNKLTELISGPYLFRARVSKAKKSDDLVFTKERFETFPDLIHSTLKMKQTKVLSNANPQQSDYRWGTAELVAWKDKNGKGHQGMLFKPDGFDPDQKYPMIVNFYERSSNGLHRHRAPYAHRSTINYSFYVNRGYVIFNPDVHYENGYPGESCYNSVMSGIAHVEQMGFVDKDRIGVQGHSWGGYQIAHLITKTDKFKCAESGAPVVNMFSAYGGIRWGSGMSRMFQYEHTQSRIGKTIWEDFDLYKENSPLFNLDKVNTPVLILHNDNDGAVPWYQGIEFFVAMRRLGKDAWMLNYNGEPHWPLKRQNRLDFNKRMQQFFDYYLMDAALPKWMNDGVPAKEKSILQGLELIEK